MHFYYMKGFSIRRRPEFLHLSGIYNSSKAAETWISETLRIEMEPVDKVQTNFFPRKASPKAT